VLLAAKHRYNAHGNGQCERYNGIIWSAVRLASASRKLAVTQWECVLLDALHSIRSLLCTATTQHRMSDYSITSGDRPLGFLYLPGWVLQDPYFWGGMHFLLSTNYWWKRPIWCMPRPAMLVLAFLLAETRRCRYETLLQWSDHLHCYSMLQISATLHCPEVLVSNRKIWAGIRLFPLTISRHLRGH